jgi:hypothetical protein
MGLMAYPLAVSPGQEVLCVETRHPVRPGWMTYWLCAGDDGGRVHLELATDPAGPRRRTCGAAGDPAAWGPSGKRCMRGHDASNFFFFSIASRFHVLCSACTRRCCRCRMAILPSCTFLPFLVLSRVFSWQTFLISELESFVSKLGL